MLFGFLMCVNKYVPYIDEALMSMLDQEFTDEYSIVVVANNCEDELWLYLQGFNDRTGGRITLHRTSVGQLAFNLNYGTDHMRCDYIVRMDADDVCESNRLSRLKSFIVKTNYPDVVGSAVTWIDETGAELKKVRPITDSKKIANILPFKNPITHPSAALKRESLLKVQGYANGLHSEDYDLWLRMRRAGLVFCNCDEYLLRYRINPYQIKGSRLAHAEVCSYMLREFLVTGQIRFILAVLYQISKYIIKLPVLK